MPAVSRLDHGGMSLWLSSAGRPEELLYRGGLSDAPALMGGSGGAENIAPLTQ